MIEFEPNIILPNGDDSSLREKFEKHIKIKFLTLIDARKRSEDLGIEPELQAIANLDYLLDHYPYGKRRVDSTPLQVEIDQAVLEFRGRIEEADWQQAA